MHKRASPLIKPGAYSAIRPAIAAVAIVLACFALACGARGQQQSAQDATTLLTTGQWNFGGVPRTFHPDGTWTSSNGSAGKWQITDTEVDISFKSGRNPFKFPLPLNPNGTHGARGQTEMMLWSDDPSQLPANLLVVQPNPPPAAPPTPASTAAPGAQQKSGTANASELFKTYHDSFAFASGTDTRGGGFVTTMNGGNFLFTSAHVAAAMHGPRFCTVDGTAFNTGVASVAVAEDVLCMNVPAGGKPLEILEQLDTNAAVGDAVVLFERGLGPGEVNTITGKIVGIDPGLVEVDAPFTSSDSGSPIIHLKSGKVIGVADCNVPDNYNATPGANPGQPVVRRFASRLDSIKAWQPVNWLAFEAQGARMDAIEALTFDLNNLYHDLSSTRGAATLSRQSNPAIKIRVDDWLEAKKGHPSAEDAAEADATLLSFLKTTCESDIAAAQQQLTYDYFLRELAEKKHTRDLLAKDFQQMIQNLGQ